MFLFKLIKNSKAALLLGSMHTFEFNELPEDFKKEILKSNVLVSESSNAIKSPKEKLEFLKKINGLKDPVSNQGNVLEEYSVEEQDLITQKVMNVIKQKELELKFNELSLNGIALILWVAALENGMDNVIAQEYIKSNKKLLHLDEEEQQIEILKFNANALIYEGLKVFKGKKSNNKEFNLTEYYNEGLISGLMLKNINNNYNISERNKQWVSKIKEIFEKEQDVIFGVGALHLFGEEGIIRLFMKEGYKFEKYQDDWKEFSIDDLIQMEFRGAYNDLKMGQLGYAEIKNLLGEEHFDFFMRDAIKVGKDLEYDEGPESNEAKEILDKVGNYLKDIHTLNTIGDQFKMLEETCE